MKILLFDFDGVIVDSLGEVCKFVNKYYAPYGLVPIENPEEFASLYDGNFFEEIQKHGVSKDVANLIHRKKTSIDDCYNTDKVKLFPKIKETLDFLSKGNLIFIVTSCLTSAVTHKLKSEKIGSAKAVIGCDIEISKVKKIEKLKREYPSGDFYYIGDTIGDIIDGRKANVKTIAVTWGFHRKEKLQMQLPDFIADKPEELIKIINA